MFTAEEIETANRVRDAIIKDNITELKSVYMAGEIVMWDELVNKAKKDTELHLSQLIQLIDEHLDPLHPIRHSSSYLHFKK